MTKRNQGRFDGLPVEIYDGKFAGTFDMEPEQGEDVAYDDVLTFLVVAVAGKVAIGATKSGDLKRTNTFEILNVNTVPQSLAIKVANELSVQADGVNAGQLSAFDQEDVTATFDDNDLDDDDVEIVSNQGNIAVASSVSDPALKDFLEEDF
jgi:NACalpha-BTF3-like transcription factor